jgi:hypothetical protein
VLGRGTNSYKLWLDTAGYPHFDDGVGHDLVGTNVVTDGNWHMLAATYDGSSSASLYVDSTNIVSESFGAGQTPFYKALLIGGDSDQYSDQLIGNMAHVAIFSNVLSAEQVAALYYAANPPSSKAPPSLQQPVFPVAGVTPNFWSNSTYVFRPVVSDPAPNANLVYSWKLNNVLINKATNSYLAFPSIPGLAAGNTYTLKMTAADANGSTNSSVSFNVVVPPPMTYALYNDSFTRTGPLNGTQPDVADEISATWMADWTFSCTGAEVLNTSLNANVAALPFVPQTGHVYVLSCDMNEGGQTSWAALGFASGESTAYNSNNYAPYLTALGDHTSSTGIQMWWSSASSQTAQPYDYSGSIPTTYQIVLDTRSEPWQASFAEDGVVLYPATPFSPDPSIGSVFIANYQTGGAVFDNFELTDNVAVGGGAHIEGQPPTQVFALQTFPATMSVAAIGSPVLQYQWKRNNLDLSNNGRIVGSQSNVLTILAAAP